MKTIVTAPVLAYIDCTGDVVIKTDISDWVSTSVLRHQGDERVLHPVAFYLKKHSSAETNYKIYYKELITIVRAFEKWRAEL